MHPLASITFQKLDRDSKLRGKFWETLGGPCSTMEEKPLHLKQTLTMMDTCQEQVHLCLCHSCIIYSAYEYVLYLCFTVSFFFYDSNMSESFLQGTMSAGLSSSGTTFGCFSVTSVHHGGPFVAGCFSCSRREHDHCFSETRVVKNKNVHFQEKTLITESY